MGRGAPLCDSGMVDSKPTLIAAMTKPLLSLIALLDRGVESLESVSISILILVI
jgi:hypothetical protein